MIAFLRGINVGGHRTISMSELRDVLTAAGYADVRTHLQSGNVVLTSRLSPAKLERALEQLLADRFGSDARVLVRTREELADVVARDPFAGIADNPSRHLVVFLSAEPAAEVLRGLEALQLEPERFVASGREIYAWHPDGLNRSKLAPLLVDRRLGVTATGRNWNTVCKLLELA
jgi:uncharacterized protein (DUF1697 family)